MGVLRRGYNKVKNFYTKTAKSVIDPLGVFGDGNHGLRGILGYAGDKFNLSSPLRKEWDQLTGAANLQSQESHQDWMRHVQEREWERQDTAWTRQVQDMKNAGLNPILAAGGAGAPTGAVEQPSAPQRSGSKLEALMNKAQFAMQMKSGAANLKNLAGQFSLMHAQSNRETAQAHNLNAQTDQINHDLIEEYDSKGNSKGSLRSQDFHSRIEYNRSKAAYNRLNSEQQQMLNAQARRLRDKYGVIPQSEIGRFASDFLAGNAAFKGALSSRELARALGFAINMIMR